jgi:hypothetical protein
MRTCKPESPTDEIDERELSNFQKMAACGDMGVVGALDYCVENEICAPAWVNQAALKLLVELLKREKAKKRGRAAGRIARFQQEQWDLDRWDAVLEVRRMRDKVNYELRLHAELSRAPPESLLKLKAWFGHGTYACASMLLSGRNSRAGTEAIKASYRKVKRDFEDPIAMNKYYPFSHQFLRMLGLEGPLDRKPGTKMLPLSNLSP